MTSKGILAAFGNENDENKDDSILIDELNRIKIDDDENENECEEDWVKIENLSDNDDNSSEKKKSTTEENQNENDNFDLLTSVNESIKQAETKENVTNNDLTNEKVKNSSDHYAVIFTPIPPALPKEKMIVVNNLVPRTNRYDLIAAFSKFGTITHIHKMKTYALMAFSTKEEAQAAIKANNTVKILGRSIGVRVRDMDRRFREYPSDQIAFIFNLMPNVPDKVIREHFEECGKIIAMPFYRNRNGINRVIIFEKPGSADIALRLDGSTMGESKIRVKPRGARAENYYEKRTVILFNENGFTELPKSTVLKLFSDCGQIVDCDILCNIKKLAMITFKDETGAENALKLNGNNVGDIKIQIQPYTDRKYKHTKIIVFNIAPVVTSEDISDFFKEYAVIDKIHFTKGRSFALIEFANTDEYCNAFRLDGENLCGQDLSLKPFSDKDESLENILYGDDDWIAIWGDKANFRGRRRRNRK